MEADRAAIFVRVGCDVCDVAAEHVNGRVTFLVSPLSTAKYRR